MTVNNKYSNLQRKSDKKHSDTLADALNALSVVHVVARGQDLFRQGDAGDAIYLLKSGSLEVSTLSEDGRKLALNILRGGDIFGEIALLDGGRRSATVTALEDSVALRVSRQRMLSEFSTNPGLAMELMGLLIQRVRWISGQLENHALNSLEIRLARRLIYLAEQLPDGHGHIAVSQSELADHVSATREAVSKKISQWKLLGVVDIGRGKIYVLNGRALYEIASICPI